MKQPMVERIIAISGMPGSGKSLVSNVARQMGYHVYAMGDVVRDEAKRLGLEQSPANLGMIALKLRKEEGPAAVARILGDQMRNDDSKIAIVEGVRSVDELQEFRRCFKVTVLAVVCSSRTRYSRLKKRGRSDDPRNISEFRERDKRELRLGIGKVMDTADRQIKNEADVITFKSQVREALEEMSRVG